MNDILYMVIGMAIAGFGLLARIIHLFFDIWFTDTSPAKNKEKK